MEVINIVHLLGILVVFLGTISFGLQTIMKNWKSNSTESSLLTLMHGELERMSSQNTTLSTEIGKLQVELVKLSNQLSRLNVENQKLQEETSMLNMEISRLHTIMMHQVGEPPNVLKKD